LHNATLEQGSLLLPFGMIANQSGSGDRTNSSRSPKLTTTVFTLLIRGLLWSKRFPVAVQTISEHCNCALCGAACSVLIFLPIPVQKPAQACMFANWCNRFYTGLCGHEINWRDYLSTWFLGANLESIRLGNLLEMLVW